MTTALTLFLLFSLFTGALVTTACMLSSRISRDEASLHEERE